MKKLICTILTAIMMLSMVACSEPEKTVVLTYEESGAFLEYTMKAKGDVVKEITQVTTLDLSLYGSEQIAAVQEACEEADKLFGDLSCATYAVDESETELVETIFLDVSTGANIEEISDAGVLQFDVEDADYISLEKTVDNLEASGFTVVE